MRDDRMTVQPPARPTPDPVTPNKGGVAHSTNCVEMRARADAALADRWKGYPLSINDWGPVCMGCGGDEFRIDGYCSCECRDYCNDEDVEQLARDVLALSEVVAEARLVRDVARRGFGYGWRRFDALVSALTASDLARAKPADSSALFAGHRGPGSGLAPAETVGE